MSEPTTLDLVTLVIAVLGVALGAAGFALRIADYRRTGSRVEVGLRSGLAGVGGILLSFDIDKGLGGNEIPPGFQHPIYVVNVRNLGHGATTVQSVAIDVGGGFTVRELRQNLGDQLPFRLEGESAATFVLDAANVAAGHVAADVFGSPPHVQAVVALASGQERRSRSYDL